MIRNSFLKWLTSFTASAFMLCGTWVQAQDDVQSITIACQASLREINFWCVTIAQAEGATPSPVEQENNCREAKQRSDRYCYPLQVPQLGCTSALQEMEIWCGGKAKFNLTNIVNYCEQSQRNVRVFCYR